MLKHQLVVATLAFATLTYSENGGRAATLAPVALPHSTTTTLVRFGGGHGFGGGGWGHFGGGGWGHFGGGGWGGFRHYGFAPRHAFVGRFHRPLVVHRFHRPVFFHPIRRHAFFHPIRRHVFFHPIRRHIFFRPIRRHVFVRRAFFVGAPVYGYYAGCAWLRHRALLTGSPYWWQRYRWCRGW